MKQTPHARLFDFVSEYESDTFSAKGSGLTSVEALKIVDGLMEHAVRVMMGETTHEHIEIDGVALADMLEGVRNE